MLELDQSSINEFLTPLFEATEVSVRFGHTFDYRFVFKKAEIRFIFAPAETPDHYRFRLVPLGFPGDSFEAVATIDGITATPGGELFGEFRLDIGEFMSPSSPFLAGWIVVRNAPDKIKKGYKRSECYVDDVGFSNPREVVELMRQSSNNPSEDGSSEFLFVAVHVGGSGYGLSENDVVGFGSDEDGIELVLASSRSRIHLPYGDIIDISFDGGTYQKGGGFSGGGFGLVGFAVGAAASMALNKVTTRTEVQTHVRITTNRGEVNLYTNQISSNDLEMSLSEIRTRIRQVNSQGQLQSPAPNSTSLSDELLKISELHKSGVLTDEEFQAAKQRLIG
jgi:hypothetical protein